MGIITQTIQSPQLFKRVKDGYTVFANGVDMLMEDGLKSKMTKLKIQAIYYGCYTIMAISIIAMWIIAFPFLLMADWSEGMVNKYNVAHQLCKIKTKGKKNG